MMSPPSAQRPAKAGFAADNVTRIGSRCVCAFAVLQSEHSDLYLCHLLIILSFYPPLCCSQQTHLIRHLVKV